MRTGGLSAGALAPGAAAVERLAVVGVSHRGAPLTLLERLSVTRGQVPPLLQALRAKGCQEVVLLSTCSRTEVYARLDGDPSALLGVLAAHGGLSMSQVQDVAEVDTGLAAVRHLFRVVAGLESRVVGEVEIQGQARSAFRQAQAAGLVGAMLGRLFPAALRCGEQVRAATVLGEQGRSLARRAVDLGLSSVADVDDPRVLVVGSGRMAATAVEHLRSRGHHAQVAARDRTGASRLAAAHLICPLPELARGVAEADLLLCATSAAGHVVTLEHVRQAMAGRTRALTVVDLSVPRNVDPEIEGVAGVSLIDVDSMHDEATLDPGLAAAARQASSMVEEATRRYAAAEAARTAGPVIAALRRRIEQTCVEELTRLAPGGDGDLARMAHALAGKVAHRPSVLARDAAAAGDHRLLRLLCDVYEIPHEVAGAAAVG